MESTTQQPVVLLMDDNTLVGFDLKLALEEAGYRVLGPLATSREARSLMEREAPTLAIVEIMLRDGPCVELVRDLRRRGVPFLVHSVCRQDEPLAGDFQGVPWLSKPAMAWDVVALLDEMSLSVASFLKNGPSGEPVSALQRAHPAAHLPNPFVRKLEGFAALSAADRALLEQISAEPRTVAPHTDLAREGDKPEGVFLIMEGMAFRHKLRASGSRQIMAYLLPGDLCDLDVALLDAMDHTISTLSACKVVRIAPETVSRILEHHPAIARALRKSTLVDEATLREWLVNVGRRSAPERLAHLFCELLVRWQAIGRGDQSSYELPLTQIDLADTTGLTGVHVNRTLQDLRRRGLIELKGGRLTILDLPRLRALAEFKSNYLHLGDRAAA